jgi:Zn-dependent alcohol dehydrogenase
MPCVLGHEGAGIVEALGAAPQREDLRPGDRVLLSFDYCGDCPNCRTGFVARCHRTLGARARPDARSEEAWTGWGAINFGRVKQATTLKAAFSDDNGGRIGSAFFGQSSFAQHAVVSISSCVKVPADTNLRLLSSLGCVHRALGQRFN